MLTQPNPIRIYGDFAFPVEGADGLFEVFFADAEGVTDFFRSTFVVEGKEALISFQGFQNSG